MFQLNVTIGLNAETLALFSKLFSGAQPAALSEAKAEAPKGIKVVKQPEVVNGHSPATDFSNESSGSGSTATLPAVNIEQVRAAVQAKAQAGKREDVKNLLLNDFQAANVMKLQPEHYAEFLTKLEAL